MPLSALVKLGSNDNNGSTTITVSPSRDVQVGEFITVGLTERDNGFTSLADNSSQAGTANTYTQDVARTTADPFSWIFSCKVTRKILSTDTITATFAAIFGGKTMCVLALPDANASAQLDKTATAQGASSAVYSSGATATTAQADEYAVGCAVVSVTSVDPTTITADSPWTLQSSAVQSGYGGAHGSQVLTATGTPAFTGGWGATTNGQSSGVIATYKGTVAGPAVVLQLVAARTSYIG